jgi:hypothetical protein
MKYETLYFPREDENPFTDTEIMVTMSQDEFQTLLKVLSEHDGAHSKVLCDELQTIFSQAKKEIFEILTTYNPCDAES